MQVDALLKKPPAVPQELLAGSKRCTSASSLLFTDAERLHVPGAIVAATDEDLPRATRLGTSQRSL